DEAVAQVGYPQLLERLVGALAVIRVPEVQGAEGDLVTDRRPHQLVLEVLVDVADTAGELRDAGVPGIDPLHVHGAGEVAVPVVRDQAVERLAQGGLGRAVAPTTATKSPRSIVR